MILCARRRSDSFFPAASSLGRDDSIISVGSPDVKLAAAKQDSRRQLSLSRLTIVSKPDKLKVRLKTYPLRNTLFKQEEGTLWKLERI